MLSAWYCPLFPTFAGKGAALGLPKSVAETSADAAKQLVGAEPGETHTPTRPNEGFGLDPEPNAVTTSTEPAPTEPVATRPSSL